MEKSRTGKKIFSLILTLCMVLSLLPAMGLTASAAPTSTGISITTTTPSTSGSGWSWDLAAKTLTLSGVDIETSGNNDPAVYIGGDSDSGPVLLVLEGANRLKNTGNSDALRAGMALTIKGSGTLEVDSSSSYGPYGINVTELLTVESGYITAKGTRGIYAASVNIIGGYVEASGTESGISVSTTNYTQSGGYVKAAATHDGGVVSNTNVIVSGGYLEASGLCGIRCVDFTNEGGVVKATGTASGNTSYGIRAGFATLHFNGGVTIASATGGTGTKALFGECKGGNGEQIFDNTGASVAATGAALSETGQESALASVVVAKAAYSAKQTALTTLNGTYIKAANASALMPTAAVTVSGGSYLESTGSSNYAYYNTSAATTVNKTLVCIGGNQSATFSGLTVETGATLYSSAPIGGASSYGSNHFTINGNLIGVGNTGIGASRLTVNGGYVCGIGKTNYGVKADTVLTVTNGYCTFKGNLFGVKSSGTVSFTGGSVTAAGTQNACNFNSVPNLSANKIVFGSTNNPGVLEEAAYGTDTYQIGGANCKVVFFTKDSPTPKFDLRNGMIVNEKPTTDPTWNDYEFIGWYTGVDGAGLELPPVLVPGETYYARWMKGNITVRTRPLDLTGTAWQSEPGCVESMGMWTNEAEGWIWDSYTNTLTLSGAIIDCSAVTDCNYAVKLPVGATIYPMENTVNTVKSGAKNGESYGILGVGNMAFTGSGSIAVAAHDVSASEGAITSCAINADARTNAVSFSGTVQVTANGGSANMSNASSTYAYSCGILGAASVSGSASVVATGSNVPLPSGAMGMNFMSVGINGAASISGGSLTATGGAAGYSLGVNGAVSATGGNAVIKGELMAIGNGALAATGATIKAGDNNTGTDTAYSNQKWVSVSFGPSITVAVNGTPAALVYGAPVTMRQDYTVTPANFGGAYPAYSGGVQWHTNGAWGIAAPTGITVTQEGKVATTAAADAGEYRFRIVSGEYISNEMTLTVLPADYTYTAAPAQDIMVGSGLSAITAAPAKGVGVNGEEVSGTVTWYSDSGRTNAAVNTDLSTRAAGETRPLYWKFVATDSNYVTTEKIGSTTFTFVEGEPQNLVFTTPAGVTKTYGDASFTNAATNRTTGGAVISDGGTISYESSVLSVATVNSVTGAVTIVGAGTTVITANVTAVTGAYAAGTQSYTLTVNPAIVTVKADDKTMSVGGVVPELTVSYTGFIGSDNAGNALAVAAAAFCVPDPFTVGEYPITISTPAVLNSTNGANYTLVHADGLLRVKNSCELLVLSPVTDGAFRLYLRGYDMGDVRLASVAGGWTIQLPNGLYLARDGGVLYLSAQPDVWSYRLGFFFQREASRSLFGATTYYLSAENGAFIVDSSLLNAHAQLYKAVSFDEHRFGEWRYIGGGLHERVCRVCGESESASCLYDPHTGCCVFCGEFDERAINVSVSVSVTKQRGVSAWSRRAAYVAEISAEAFGTHVAKIEYSLNNLIWTRGTTVDSPNDNPHLYIRVTDADGGRWLFEFQNGIVSGQVD